jgi:quinoprotein glucose dehydrogenase
VGRLVRAWTYHTGELDLGLGRDRKPGEEVEPFESTPLMVDGVLYLSTPSRRVIALDAETGKEIWKFDPQPAEGEYRSFERHRGVAYWEKGADKRIIFGTVSGMLVALDARTGRPCPDFGLGGVVNLHAGVGAVRPDELNTSSPPAIYHDLVLVGSAVPETPSLGPSGMVRAFDVRTGRLVWEFHTVPRPGEAGHETWEGDSWKDRTGVNAWAPISVDANRGIVFLPLGSPSYDFYGADRKGQNLFGNTLVALNAETGKLLWYFQAVHHDLWDYDLPAQPVLATVQRDGREIPVVAQVTKMGFVFVLDRLSGKPLFPVEERPVPQSVVPGEATWRTQPFPLKPPPLSRQHPITRADLSTVTTESEKFCAALFDSLQSVEVYTPVGLEQVLSFPGSLGGANWSGASFDPATGYLYVNTNELGTYGAMKAQPQGSPVAYRRSSSGGEYARFWDPEHRPCQQPPWGTLNAVDLNTGELAWKVPLGVVEELGEKSNTGALNLGGSIVTAGGLVFIAGTNDARFRAFDARTGGLLWEARLEAAGHATPITYLGRRTRKQFVVIAAGGGGFVSKVNEPLSDVLVAYALRDPD